MSASPRATDAPIAAPPIAALRGVRFAYPGGSFALELAALELARGERVALIGPSGSGKTTLAELIAGIRSPQAGTVQLCGVELTALGEAERRALRIAKVGFVFQRFELFEYLSALDNILLPYHLNRALALDRAARERARELAAAVGVEQLLSRIPSRLSQGERQRVALCRALIAEPELVIADEPTGNLDPSSSARALDLLIEQVERRGATLLVITHDHGLLGRFERVIDLRALVAGEGRPAVVTPR
ncbi:MAG: ATP-binding cassette domain-containing protein [Planctomycetes bacterium]|nr:ATP-binding cassette domain-containing protein [Planctomycetota bacterium]